MKGWTDGPVRRSPGTPARVLLLVTSVAAFVLTLAVAFPPGAPDRLPVLALSILLALLAAERWSRGVAVLSFLVPCAGLAARLSGGADPSAWPVLLFAGLAAGWTFRFLYDFDTLPEPSRPDAPLRALAAVWVLALLLAVARAHTLWALSRGLSGRAVNGDGLPESTAIRESFLSFGALASGIAFFFLLRRSGEEVRRRALTAMLAGSGLSALAAALQAAGLLPGETRAFWKLTERLPGGASDPNSLGLLCGMALVVSLAAAGYGRGGRLWGLLAVVLFAAGLFLSGSRSGLLIVLIGLFLAVVSRRLPGALRAAALAAGAGLVLGLALLLARASPGTLGGRIAETFDPSLPVEYRVSARPVLWSAAARMFREHPLAGGGMGAFSWRLPDLLRALGTRLPGRDNPGSGYVQALAETGILGLGLTLLAVVALGRDAFRRLSSRQETAAPLAASLAVLGFLAALAVGSHWLASEAALFFFLLASVVAVPATQGGTRRGRAWLAGGVLLYAAAALFAILGTTRPAEAFRYSREIGFYPPEKGGFRWTRQNFALRLAPGERRRLGLANFSPEGAPVELVARETGRILLRKSLAPGQAAVLDLAAPADRAAAFCFSLSRSFVPKRLGIPGGDRRQLGLQAVFLGG